MRLEWVRGVVAWSRRLQNCCRQTDIFESLDLSGDLDEKVTEVNQTCVFEIFSQSQVNV